MLSMFFISNRLHRITMDNRIQPNQVSVKRELSSWNFNGFDFQNQCTNTLKSEELPLDLSLKSKRSRNEMAEVSSPAKKLRVQPIERGILIKTIDISSDEEKFNAQGVINTPPRQPAHLLHECRRCDFKCPDELMMRAHWLVHTGEQIRCPHPMCRIIFESHSKLWAHLNLIHSNHKSFECPHCGTRSQSMRALACHIRDYKCEKIANYLATNQTF